MHSPMPSSELINFCLQPLVDLTSNAVSADDYPITNLVSISPSARSRGFRVEHFIRPPIQLDFEFRLPLNIACIIVQPELAPLAEMRLELAASFHTTSTCSNLVTICPNVVVKDSQAVLLLENKAFKKRDGRVFSISKTDLTSCQVEGSFTSQSGGLSRAVRSGVTVQPLKHPNILSKLRQLRLTVSRITGPKPLTLKSLEVWGSLSSSSSCSIPSHVDCLQSCLAVVQREKCAASSDKVNLYCSTNYSPEQGPVAGGQDTITSNDLHKACVDRGQACSCARDRKTRSSHEGKLCKMECGSLGQEECHSGSLRVQGWPVFGGAETDTQEVGHIKELTSENKESPKPQQSITRAHLHGCSHNIGKGKKKPGSSSGEWLEGRNGSPPSTSLPTHNSNREDEDTSQLSCGLQFTNNKAAMGQQLHKQQQLKEGQTQPTSGDHEIPNEFLDKITYDVMHVPMLLPSGHCVDRSTVEKLANNDALYGRPPTDPFTGIPFSRISKPEFFPKLKLQLDRFLSSRTEDTSAQTLGSADKISTHLYMVGRSGGDGRHNRDQSAEEGSSKGPPRKKLRSMTMNDASNALESACPTAEGTGFCPVWVCPTTGSPSYGKGSTGSAIKDQRTTHRMHHHDAPCSSTQLNHSFQDGRNPFEQEVAGSLDDALKQLLSKK